MRYFCLLLFTLVFANASLLSYTYNNKELEILKSFDIDGGFIHDPYFEDLKKSVVNGYEIDRLFRKYDEGYEFVPILTDMLKEAGIPPEFLYLAMVESEFSTRAYSPKHAAGLWQFIPGTAKMYGLSINSYIDERRDPIKSTWAAINYLQDLHSDFGKWYLAAIAYNCGPGRLRSAISQAKSDDLKVLLDPKKKYIPRESRNYIRKILSVSMAFNSIDLLLNSNSGHFLNRGASYPISTIKLKGGTHLKSVSDSMGMKLEELKSYNRHLRYDFIPPSFDEYEIYIPYKRLSFFRENFDDSKISLESVFEVHRVKRGDTLSSIGEKFGISWRLIRDSNNLKSNLLSVNQQLIIPVTKTLKKERSVPNSVVKYTIKKGDTIYSIAKRYNTTEDKIIKRNNLDSTLIRPGDVIEVQN